MKEELMRIKQKDYSQIDQKLFENIARADNLTSTLSQLSEFQQFLMQQINAMNCSQQLPAASLRSSITRNFDNLRESLLQCSRQHESGAASALRRHLVASQMEAGRVRKQVKEQIQRACSEVLRQAERGMMELLRLREQETIRRVAAQQECAYLKQQNEQLKQENEQLTRQKQLFKEGLQTPLLANQILKQRVPSPEPQKATQAAVSRREVKAYETGHKEESSVLKERLSSNIGNLPPFSDQQCKSRREARFSTVKQGRESLSRNNSSHRLSSKQNPVIISESRALLSKGVLYQPRRASRQKLKVFSMM